MVRPYFGFNGSEAEGMYDRLLLCILIHALTKAEEPYVYVLFP